MTWALQPPTWWPALLLLPLALLGCWWWARRARWRLRADLGPREAYLCGKRSFVRSRGLLAVLALAAIGVALLRPVTPGKEAQLAPDVVLCVDVSRSMAAGDGDPTRFDAMRQQVHALLQQGIGSRFALLAFAGGVQGVAPLTADREAVAWLLDELAPGAITFADSGTNLGAAITAAADSLDRVGSVGEVLLLTDGEDFGGEAAQAAAAVAGNGHRVHCIGYGSTAGSKVVIYDGDEQTFLQDGAGNDVITRLEVESLTAIADSGAGSFVAPDTDGALVDLWTSELVPYSAERRLQAGDTDVLQGFAWPLLAGLLLLMLRMCLPERMR